MMSCILCLTLLPKPSEICSRVALKNAYLHQSGNDLGWNMRQKNADAQVYCVVGIHILNEGCASMLELFVTELKPDVTRSIGTLQITLLAIYTFLEQHLYHM
jgi:hypothetical protein